MKTQEETVKTQDGGEFSFDMPMPESTQEAIEVYGEDSALWLLNSGLKVKLQNIAREHFRQGKSKEEAEEAVRNYRPGASTRKGVRQRALELITEHALTIQNDPDLKKQVGEAFASSNFRDVVDLLEGIED